MKKIYSIVVFAVIVLCIQGAAEASFSDDFESYANGATFTTPINGWHSPTNTVVVQTVVVNGGSKAVELPSDSSMSNVMNGAGMRIVWVDQYIQPCLGGTPVSAPDSNSAVHAFFDAAGYLVVGSSGSWDPCLLDLFGNSADKATGGWLRLSIYHNFTTGKAGFLLNGNVLREGIPFNGTNINEYSELLYRNLSDGTLVQNDAYLDDVIITADLPSGLDSGPDSDSDGVVDAVEIHLYGTTAYNSRFPQIMPFSDDFESYTAGDELVDLGASGWDASDTTVVVQATESYEGSQAVLLPKATDAENHFVTATDTVWADFYVLPPLGAQSSIDPASKPSVRLYFNENGYVTIATTNNDWDVCSESVFGNSVTPVSNQWVRITLHHDYVKKEVAVLLDGRVLRDQIPFLNSDITGLDGLSFINNGGTAPVQTNAYFDKVLVRSALPPGFTIDEDNDFMVDALEIDVYGTATGKPAGTYLIIR